MLSFGTVAKSQLCQEPIVVGEISINSADFERRGDYVFFPVVFEGLVIADVTDPENPVEIGRAESPLILNQITMSGDLAVLNARDSGLVIFDVSDATQPELVGQIASGREHTNIELDGEMLYAARRNVGIDVYDLSNPAEPSLITTYGDGSMVGSLEVVENRLHIAAVQSGLSIVDISDPSQPVLLSQLDITVDGRVVTDLRVDQGLALVNLGEMGAALVDVQDAQAPEVLSYLPEAPVGDGPHRVALNGDRAYLSYLGDGLYIFDVSVPSGPLFMGKHSGLDGVFSMEFEGDTGYISETVNGYSIIDASSITFAEPLRHDIDVFGMEPAETALVSGGTSLLVSDASGGLVFFDVSDPGSMTPVANLDLDGEEGGLAVRGDGVYVAAGEAGIHWLSVPETDSVTVLDTIDTPGLAIDVELWLNFAFVSDHGGGLQIINLSAPGTPIVGSFQTPLRVTDVRVEEGVAYVNDPGFGVYILDVSTPAQPALIGHIDPFGGTNTNNIELYRDVLYVGLGSNTVQMYDVANPANPMQIGTHSFWNSTSDAVFDGDTMYIGGNSVYAADISDPARIQQLWRLDAGYASGLSLLDGRLFAADQTGEQIGDEFGALIALELIECRVFCRADLNQDDRLDFFDVTLFLLGFMNADPVVDFNQDGAINFFDVTEFIEAYQSGCP